MPSPNEHLRADLVADARRRAGLPPEDPEQQPQAHEFAEAEIEIARAVDAERRRALDIMRACAMAGRQDLAADLIAGGQPLGQVVRQLERARGTGRGASRA